MTDPGHPEPRLEFLAAALRLSYFTVAWNGSIGAVGLAVALSTGSLAVAGLAVTALLDASASAVLAWRFVHERRHAHAGDRVEARAQAVVAVAMMSIGVFVVVNATRALASGSHADESELGFVVAIVSVLILPWLGRRKLRVAAGLASAALRGDGVLTLAGAALAVITLVALLVSSAFDWWWADPAAALVISIGLAAEGLRVAIRQRFG